MKLPIIERVLWAGTLIGLVAAVRPWLSVHAGGAPGQRLSLPAIHAPAPFDPDTLTTAADEVAETDVFDVARSAPASRDSVSATTLNRPAPPRPTFRLHGILGGPPWDVIIEGIPGAQRAVVVRNGETVAGFAVWIVSPDSVRIRGADTTWTLSLNHR